MNTALRKSPESVRAEHSAFYRNLALLSARAALHNATEWFRLSGDDKLDALRAMARAQGLVETLEVTP